MLLISDKEKNVPDSFTIDRVYPNPFNPSVTIDYHLSNDSDINISVYDLKGWLIDYLKEKWAQDIIKLIGQPKNYFFWYLFC